MHESLSARFKCFLVFCCVLALTACDPERVVNEYFARHGLNRLASPRDDIEPGGLIVVGKQGAIYADNMLDYCEQGGDEEYGVVAGDKIGEFRAVLREYKGSRNTKASLALGFLKTFLPVDFGSAIDANVNVTMEMVNARVRRMKIPTVERFLRSSQSAPFRAAVHGQLAQKNNAFLIYEVWRTNKLKIIAEGDRAISATLNVGDVKPVISKSEAKFSLKRTSKTTMELTGDAFYVFAVRTARLKSGPGANTLAVDLTNFSKPKEWGIMSAGSDDQYTAPVLENFGALALKRLQKQQ